MRISVLINNCVHRPGLKAEHGLSLWLEEGGRYYLFDTGASGLVVDNAAVLGISLEKAEAIILSHGHYDHTGGLHRVLDRINRPITVFAHPGIWQKKGYLGEKIRDIGLPFKKEELNLAKFDYSTQPKRIAPNMWLTGEIPRETEFEEVEPSLVQLVDGNWVPDPILDDQALIIDTAQGIIVITGCAHSGIINTINYALHIANTKKLYAVIGGFHLWHASQRQLELTISALKELDPAYIITGHCTGLNAAAVLKASFKEKCIFLDVGLTLRL